MNFKIFCHINFWSLTIYSLLLIILIYIFKLNLDYNLYLNLQIFLEEFKASIKSWPLIFFLNGLIYIYIYVGANWSHMFKLHGKKAGPNIQSHIYRLHKKGLGPISHPRIREYPRMTSKGRDESCTPKRGKECLWKI